MAGGAAGGFLTRAFESMLKESLGKKSNSFQTAIRSYLGFFNFFQITYFIVFEFGDVFEMDLKVTFVLWYFLFDSTLPILEHFEKLGCVFMTLTHITNMHVT